MESIKYWLSKETTLNYVWLRMARMEVDSNQFFQVLPVYFREVAKS